MLKKGTEINNYPLFFFLLAFDLLLQFFHISFAVAINQTKQVTNNVFAVFFLLQKQLSQKQDLQDSIN